MAVSNAIGSNVFDILVCLGLPWFLQTAVVEPGSQVKIRSRGERQKSRKSDNNTHNITHGFRLAGLNYSTFSLFSTIIFLIVASHFNGWRLDRKFGIILLIWYFIFMIFAALYELNVFGRYNPPECVIDV